MVVAGEKETGLSIYRGKERISIGYRVTNAQGQSVAEGQMEYG